MADAPVILGTEKLGCKNAGTGTGTENTQIEYKKATLIADRLRELYPGGGEADSQPAAEGSASSGNLRRTQLLPKGRPGPAGRSVPGQGGGQIGPLYAPMRQRTECQMERETIPSNDQRKTAAAYAK